MLVVRTMLQLLQRAASERKIAQELGISRTTLRKYTIAFKASSFSYQQLLDMDDPTLAQIIYPAAQPANNDNPSDDTRLAVFNVKRDYFLKELKRTGVTKHVLWNEYIKEHPNGFRYTQFCLRLRNYQKTKDVSLRIEYAPADTMMIDFAGDKLYYVDPIKDDAIPCPVLVCVLPFSGYSYVEALPDASLPQLVKALNNALRFFAGAPSNLITDNMRQMVTKACRYEPVFTDFIQQWAQHNNIHLKAARVRSPRDKAHVENEVKITYSRIYAPLRNKVFLSIEELNTAIQRHLKNHHKQNFQGKDHSRLDLFTASEQLLLQSLPPQPYVMKYATEAKVQRNYHVIIGQDKHYYSVPYPLVGQKVHIVYDTNLVEIFQGHNRVAQHKRGTRRFGYTTNPDHMPDAHKSYLEQRGWNKEYLLGQAAKIGPHTTRYLELLINARAVKEHAYTACIGILRLSAAYSTQRIENACSMAVHANSFSYKIIANILANHRDTLINDNQPSLQLPTHDNIRGSEAYN